MARVVNNSKLRSAASSTRRKNRRAWTALSTSRRCKTASVIIPTFTEQSWTMTRSLRCRPRRTEHRHLELKLLKPKAQILSHHEQKRVKRKKLDGLRRPETKTKRDNPRASPRRFLQKRGMTLAMPTRKSRKQRLTPKRCTSLIA